MYWLRFIKQKQMNISIPQTLKDSTPEQLSKWIFLSGGEKFNIETLSESLQFKVQVVSIFSGISKVKLYNADMKTINDAFVHILNMLSEESELIAEVTIDGQRYVFDKKFEHKTTGLIIDLKLIENIYEQPYDILAMLYIEEGMIYNQVNEHDNIVNPISKRIEAFKKEFPGDEFLNVFAFFLNRWEKLKDGIWALNIAKAEVTMTMTKNELKNQIKMMNGSDGHQTSSSLPKN